MEPATIDQALALLKERPDDAELHQQLGRLYHESGEWAKAWPAYMQALRLDPHDPFTCLYFGNLLSHCEDKSYTLTLFENAVDVAPELAVAHWCLAELYRDLGRFDDAGREYEQAVEVEPDNADARRHLSEWRAFVATTSGGSGAE